LLPLLLSRRLTSLALCPVEHAVCIGRAASSPTCCRTTGLNQPLLLLLPPVAIALLLALAPTWLLLLLLPAAAVVLVHVPWTAKELSSSTTGLNEG
jgi:hypothetical protein